MDVMKETRSLVKEWCANYYSIENYCYWYSGKCKYFQDSDVLPQCKYFEKNVLPIDSELENEYYHDRDTGINPNIKEKIFIHCKRCNERIEVKSNRQKYCAKCKVQNNRENTKNRVKKIREKTLMETWSNVTL
jgi:hypothetical protein